MTKDEILNMPAGREMDALIAEKVIGGDFAPATEYYFRRPLGGGPKFVEHYSTDISAAWKVVEKMAEISAEHFIDLGVFGLELADCGNGVYAANFKNSIDGYFEKYDDFDWIECNDGEFGIAHGKSAPLAICRAALLALEVDTN